MEMAIVDASDLTERTSYVIKAARSTAYVFLAIWLFPSALFIFAALTHPTAGQIPEMATLLGVCGLVILLWIGRFRIEITTEQFSYTSLFGGTSSIALKDIQSVKSAVGLEPRGLLFKPPIRLEINPKTGSGEQQIIVNAKVFDKHQINCVAAKLESSIKQRHV